MQPRTWSALTAALLGGVVAWKLSASTYTGDVRTICTAERRSGVEMKRDMARVTRWVRAHLSTREGNELYSSLDGAPLRDRTGRLQTAAAALNMGSCPLAESYAQLAEEAEYRADLQGLCSIVTMHGIEDRGDDARLGVLVAFLDESAQTAKAKALAAPLRRSATLADRAKMLRDAATEAGIFKCDVAQVIEAP
jgi:hypothetical protein